MSCANFGSKFFHIDTIFDTLFSNLDLGLRSEESKTSQLCFHACFQADQVEIWCEAMQAILPEHFQLENFLKGNKLLSVLSLLTFRVPTFSAA